MYIVKKKISGKDYYYLNKSFRKGDKVISKNIAYLGKNKKEAEEKAKEIIEKMEKGISNINKGKIEQKDMDKKIESKEEKNELQKGDFSKEFTSFVQDKGFIWGPEPEIYGGLGGFYTYGPIGKLLKNKIENSVRKIFQQNGLFELEGPTVMPDIVWKASGHLETFSDPIIFTKDKKENYRADKLLEENGIKINKFEDKHLLELIKKHNIKAPNGKELELKIERQSLMMKTKVAGQDASLRPETATVTYLPFLRFYNFFRKKLPLGVFQIGKAYRNEISPRQSVIRGREFTQAEGQIFVDPKEKNNWGKFEEVKNIKLPFWTKELQNEGRDAVSMSIEQAFEKKFVKSKAYAWCLWLAYNQFKSMGIPEEKIRLRQHLDDEKAFYADDAWDIEINLNSLGWTECCGVHDRTDYDLKQHSKFSGQKLEAIRENGERFTPHVLEIAFGTDRPSYALIDAFYEKKTEGEGKTMFKVPYHMSPIDVSVFPLMKKPELIKIAEEIKKDLEKVFVVDYDISGSIGRRYLRSAEFGTPYAITIDYDSIDNKSVTVRDRDSEKQIRVKIKELKETIKKLINEELKFLDAGKLVETRVK